MKIREYLKINRLITDGAMGTYYDKVLRERGIENNEIVEKVNVSNGKVIRDIHKEYIKAGARLIRTNTFAINSSYFCDFAEMKKQIKAACVNAKQAVEEAKKELNIEDIYIAGDIGTICDFTEKTYEEITEEYKQIIDIFVDEGIEIILFETQADAQSVCELVEYVKEKNDEIYTICQFAINKAGYTNKGISINKILKTAAKTEAIDAYGFNCGISAGHLYNFMKNQEFYCDKPVAVLPNSSYPNTLRGKVLYANNATYFAEVMEQMSGLGVSIVGGCCGTTPEYIEKINEKLKEKDVKSLLKVVELKDNHKQADVVNRSKFIEKIEKNEKVLVVELDPPFDDNYEKVCKGAKDLKECEVDLLTLSDSPLARARMDAGLLATKIQNEIGINVMPHISCRDRNAIALRGTMLGLKANGIDNLLIVTGDPVGSADRESIKSVYNFNSIKLMDYIKRMNEEIFDNKGLVYGGALNYHGINKDAICKRVINKMEAGASYFLTQPIYSDEDVERIRYIKENTGAKIICGIMPLVSYKNARFIKNEMPGINIPDEIIEAYKEDMTRDEFEKVAIDISTEIARKLENIGDGYYFMTPFNRTGLIKEIIENMRSEGLC